MNGQLNGCNVNVFLSVRHGQNSLKATEILDVQKYMCAFYQNKWQHPLCIKELCEDNEKPKSFSQCLLFVMV